MTAVVSLRDPRFSWVVTTPFYSVIAKPTLFVGCGNLLIRKEISTSRKAFLGMTAVVSLRGLRSKL